MSEPARWNGISLAEQLGALSGMLLRIVESQEQVATLHLVDTMAEQGLLEEMLERAKPAARPGSAGLHYLLLTPFRYPPLSHGSRFGRRYEPSIFYGSLDEATVLAEAAFYRLIFWFGMDAPPLRPVRSQHTLYRAAYGTARGLQLQSLPFDRYRSVLTSPSSYHQTQALGSMMRSAGVLGFEFRSARALGCGINVGLFAPDAFASSEVGDQQDWLCEVDGQGVQFLDLALHKIESYPLSHFLVDGTLPSPAP